MLRKPHVIEASLYPSLSSAQAGIAGTIGNGTETTTNDNGQISLVENSGRSEGSPPHGIFRGSAHASTPYLFSCFVFLSGFWCLGGAPLDLGRNVMQQ